MSVARARTWSQPPPAPAERVAALDWERIAANLEADGCAVIGGMCSPPECRSLSESYLSDELFRSRIVPLGRGDGVIFPVHQRPVRGTRGVYRVNMRHGVSRLRSGRRHTLGVI